MAVVVQTVEKMKRSGSGLTPTFTGSLSASNQYRFDNNGKVFLHFKKTAAVNANVTIVTPRSPDGNAVADLVCTVPASTGEKVIGPFEPGVYNALGAHYVEWSVDDVDGLTVAVVRMDD